MKILKKLDGDTTLIKAVELGREIANERDLSLGEVYLDLDEQAIIKGEFK